MPTIVKENYLKALYFLAQEKNQINLTDLSKRVGVSKPTASNMVKRLQEKSWVDYEKYKPIKLTEKGHIIASQIIRKHRLTEMFLSEIMGFGWEEVHEIAEQMEHIDSSDLFDRMDQMLDHPNFDPHGSPIPDKQGKVIRQALIPVAELKKKQNGRLAGLTNSSAELLLYLNKCKIKLGTKIELLSIEEYDGSCSVICDNKRALTLSQKLSYSLLVEIVSS